jgi:hypothetical protein
MLGENLIQVLLKKECPLFFFPILDLFLLKPNLIGNIVDHDNQFCLPINRHIILLQLYCAVWIIFTQLNIVQR